MLVFYAAKSLRKGKVYSSSLYKNVSDNKVTEIQNSCNSDTNKTELGPEVATLTQEQFDTQVKAHIAPISQQLANLTKLIQNLR